MTELSRPMTNEHAGANIADPGTAQPPVSDFVIERKNYEKASLNCSSDKRIGNRSGGAFWRSDHHSGSQN